MTDIPKRRSFTELDEGLSSSSERVRWSAAEAAGGILSKDPEMVWNLIVKHGCSANEDLRVAVATCMLEHLLEDYFDEYFPRVEFEVLSGRWLLGDTLRRCWKLGKSETPANSERWDAFIARNRKRWEDILLLPDDSTS